MIIYSVQISLDEAAVGDWTIWMKDKHIPDVMKTGCFSACDLGRVVSPPPVNGRVAFRVDYRCLSRADLDRYQQTFAEDLQAEHTEKFSGRFLASRTVLEIIEPADS